MPNKRAKGRKKAIFWLSNYEDELLQKLADIDETTRTNVFRAAIMMFASKRGLFNRNDSTQEETKTNNDKTKGE